MKTIKSVHRNLLKSVLYQFCMPSLITCDQSEFQMYIALCRGPTARFLKNRDLHRNSGSPD